MPVPDRLEKLITSKIDQLHPVHALILRVCSCIASHITLEILAEVVPLNITSNELAGEMVVLEKADLLVRSSDEAREFEFKQNIVMEVAYSTLAFGTRQTLHNAIAEKFANTLFFFFFCLILPFSSYSSHFFFRRRVDCFPLLVQRVRSSLV